MSKHVLNKHAFKFLFGLGALAVIWVGAGFAGNNPLALAVTTVIATIYVLGALELRQFRQDTLALSTALHELTEPLPSLQTWLDRLPAGLQNPVRLRIEGERVGLPAPALTPYLVGLLVMLGMLGTFLGMVVTLNGAVFALEATTDLQAIRSAFATPIRGLGLAFGTSVAGVASSAMLGLISTLSRRERQQAAQTLDTKVATVLRGFSLTHQRQEAFKALQQQSQAWPAVMEHMQAMMAQMQQTSQQLSSNLQSQQERFHQETKEAYTTLAHSVEQSLQRHLAQSMQSTGETIKPIVQSAMAGLAQEAATLHQSVLNTTQTQLQDLTNRFNATTTQVADTWAQGLATQVQGNTELVHNMQSSLQGFAARFDQSAHDLVSTVNNAYTRLQAEQASSEQQQLDQWSTTLETLATNLTQQWQQTTEQAQTQQQRMGDLLEHTVQQITQRVQTSASQTLAGVERMQSASEELAQSRINAEAAWTQQHQARMGELTQVLRTELTALRDDEAQRGAAAVARLSELQSAVTEHLTTLGTALEGPITRLVQTTAEVPNTAAEVIAQLRQEMSNSLVRDNELLEERSRIMATLHTLLEAIQHASTEQRAVIDSLVASSATALHEAGAQFANRVQAETGKLASMAEQVSHSTADITSSAVDVSSLSEALGAAVQSFSNANGQLVEHLQHIESALEKSMTRSDEQLAYYVAQAREIIDLSVTSQKEVVDELRQLRTV